MKRIALLIAVAAIVFAPAAHAQNHGEVGAFVDYFRLHQTGSNFVGLGARATINAAPHVQIEAEMAYDSTVFLRKISLTRLARSSRRIPTQKSFMACLVQRFRPQDQSASSLR